MHIHVYVYTCCETHATIVVLQFPPSESLYIYMCIHAYILLEIYVYIYIYIYLFMYIDR